MLILSLLISINPLRIYANDESEIKLEREIKNELTLSKVTNKNQNSYRTISIFYEGRRLNSEGRLINGITYVPLRLSINELAPDMKVSYDSKTRTITVEGAGFLMTVKDLEHTANVNGRILFATSPSVILNDGRIYVPISIVAKALGIRLNPQGTKIEISGKITPLKNAEIFYREDEVYWLSRIISAESRGESLLGKIAVGNVVLNRVKSSLYPNTIWGVIFDKKYGVQFSPVLDGSIYSAPTAESVLAAKIVLEGYSITAEALFFIAPRYAESSWIPKSRKYEFSIGGHDFYS